MLDWAAPMDSMREPAMLASTGLSVEDHQRRTVANFLQLRERGPEAGDTCRFSRVRRGPTTSAARPSMKAKASI